MKISFTVSGSDPEEKAHIITYAKAWEYRLAITDWLTEMRQILKYQESDANTPGLEQAQQIMFDILKDRGISEDF